MAETFRRSRVVNGVGVQIEAFVSGAGSPVVILPSYGRDGGADYDDVTGRLVDSGFQVLRPQPRGIGASRGPMSGLTLHDLASDVALTIEKLVAGPAIVLGHAFGNLVARMLTTDHPKLVKAVILAAAQARHVPADVAATPFIAGDLNRPDDDRLTALRKAFFAPNHDARIWLSGWYPETLKMQHEAVAAVDIDVYWACGSVPLLELNGEYDAFKPKSAWRELSEAFPGRVDTVLVEDAAHALFPEQPTAVWKAIEPWVKLQGALR